LYEISIGYTDAVNKVSNITIKNEDARE